MNHTNRLLAVDVHQTCAVALFCADGRLLAVGSLAARGELALREAARKVLCAGDSLSWLVSAGGPSAQATWERVAMRQGVRVQRVGQPDWQQALIDARGGPAALDQATLALATAAAREGGLAEAEHLSLDEARAICVGLWAHAQLPASTPRLASSALVSVPAAQALRTAAHKPVGKDARLRRVA